MTAYDLYKKLITAFRREKQQFLIVYIKEQDGMLRGHYNNNMPNPGNIAKVLVEASRTDPTIYSLLLAIEEIQEQEDAKAENN